MDGFSLKSKGMFVVPGRALSALFLARRALVQPPLWLGREATRWVAAPLPLGWEQGWLSIFHLRMLIAGKVAMFQFRSSSTPSPQGIILAVACQDVSLDLGENGLSYRLSGSNLFFRGRPSAQWEGCVGGPWLLQTGCSVDRHTRESAGGRLGEHPGAKEHFSNYDVPVNDLEILSECRFWLSDMGWSLKVCISHKLQVLWLLACRQSIEHSKASGAFLGIYGMSGSVYHSWPWCHARLNGGLALLWDHSSHNCWDIWHRPRLDVVLWFEMLTCSPLFSVICCICLKRACANILSPSGVCLLKHSG